MSIAAVTGSNRGIGRATAEQLATRGVRIVTVGRSDSEASSSLRRSLEAKDAYYGHIEVDLAVPSQVTEAASELRRIRGLEILVQAAGIIERGSVAELDPESVRRQFEVNLLAPFSLAQAALPHFLEMKKGRLLFVSSISSESPTPLQSAYNASKAGLTMMMRCLAEELRDTGVMAAAVLPGAVDTDMLRGSGYKPRMTAEEVAQAIAYLALDAGLAHNGSTIEMFGV